MILNFVLMFSISIIKSKKQWSFLCIFKSCSIPYGLFRVLNPYLPNKHRQGGYFFRFEHGPAKRIP